MKVLVLCTYPSLDASRRLRIDPLVAGLTRTSGAKVQVHTLLNDRAFRWKNHRVGRIYAAARLTAQLFVRLAIVGTTRPDLLIVHREAFPFFTPLVEGLAARRARLAVVDLDDAVYNNPTHNRDWRRHLRSPERALQYKEIFGLVTAGNSSVASAMTGPAEVMLYPTCPPKIELSEHGMGSGRHLIWIGSASTLLNIESVLPDVLRFCADFDYNLSILGAANIDRLPKHPRLDAKTWTPAREKTLLRTASLGLMPLLDTPWDRGKSAYKAISYLTAGVPALISPVGMNIELAQQFPAAVKTAGDDWYEALGNAVAPAAPSIEEDVARAREVFDVKKYVNTFQAHVEEQLHAS
jgi:hypothetical protein